MKSPFFKNVTFEFGNTSCLEVSDDQVSLQLCFKLLLKCRLVIVWSKSCFKMGPIYKNTNQRWFWVVLYKNVLINP